MVRGRRRRRLLLLLLVLLCGGAAPLAADEGAGVKQGVDDIQEDINQAIDRGVMWLLKEQLVDGSWGHEAGRYPGGMTGLALYTLLKSGVPATHPCVELGFENILSLEPQETYVVACHLMALGAMDDPAHHPRMAVLAERLLSWETRGSWSYPLAHEGAGWADHGGIPDLSNAQFAVLGLYAAHQAGVKIPKKIVQDVIRQLRFHQHVPREVVGTDGTVRDAAGFAYRPPDQHGIGVATGSMTCAGITVMDVCRRILGKKLTGKAGARRRDVHRVERSRGSTRTGRSRRTPGESRHTSSTTSTASSASGRSSAGIGSEGMPGTRRAPASS